MSRISSAIAEPSVSAWSAVADEEGLLRRLPDATNPQFIQRDLVTGERRLLGGAFSFDEDGLSVYREVLLEAHSLTAADIKARPANLVCRFTAAEARALGCQVAPAPWPDEDQPLPRDVAHALVQQPDGLAKVQRRRVREQLAAMAVLIDA